MEESQPALIVSELRDRTAFPALAGEWDGLGGAVGGGPFLSHAFLHAWLESFAPRGRLRVLLCRDGRGSLEAALPLVAGRGRVAGVPVRAIDSASNVHSCRFDLVARDPRRAADALLRHLAGDRSWDVLRLKDVPEDGAARHLLDAAAALGLPAGAWESIRSPYLPLPADWATLAASLPSKFKANCRRRRRRLEERGVVSFDTVEGGAAMAAALDEGLALEAAGWKGRRGTAMAQHEDTRRFYARLAAASARDGTLALHFLRLDGRPVAFQYGLRRAGRAYLLKPAYDEALGDCSPGQLLMEEVVQDAIARGCVEFDFLGPDMPWKREWTDRVRPHAWLFVFRDTRVGRLLRAAKFRWLPALKRAAGR